MKNRYVLLCDVPLIALAACGAFAARFDFLFFQQQPEFVPYIIAAVLVKPAVFMLMGMYRRYWRYASVQELTLVVLAVSASSLAMAVFLVAGIILGLIPGVSRVVFLNDWLLTLAAAGGLRLGIRVLHESAMSWRTAASAADRRRVLIVGAGAAGTLVAREMHRNAHLAMEPVGFVDDDAAKVGKRIAGLRVLGQTRVIPELVQSSTIDTVVIAMPTAPGRVVRTIVDMCQQSGVKSLTIPGVFELLDEHVSVGRLRNVDIADLLRRAPVRTPGNTAGFVAGRVVLITGGGGSIGYELGRQIASAAPAHLVLLGHGENSIFEAEARLRAAFPALRLSTVIADIRDERRASVVFDSLKPGIVFHAAAHKHVPLMEENPEEAITNNITGTRNLVAQALRTGVERFVLISTDKAVSPTSVMGATKRVGELIVREAALKSGRAFVAVRFGNVLGSRGSAVNMFKEQIEQGGPVTVTHPEMTRFFMTIPEAVHLVLQASAQGRCGELFVLDMGEPVKIVDLARDLIKLSGLSEDDIAITFTGIRPGEKLQEVLFDSGMETLPTPHPGILQVVGPDAGLTSDLSGLVPQLEEAARRGDRASVDLLLQQLLPALQRGPYGSTVSIASPVRPSIH